MAQKKKTANNNWMREELDRLKTERPIVDTRWYVIEITPAYNTGGYYDQDIPEKRVRVSEYFKSREKAVKWLNEHDPDKGNELKVAKQNLREWTVREWTNY